MSQTIEDIIVDEDDYPEEEVVAEAEQGDPRPGKMATTSTFMGAEPTVVDEIEDLGAVEIIESEDETYEVRVIDDVGPVYYGQTLIDLKQGHRYRVPGNIYRYLREKDMLWEQR